MIHRVSIRNFQSLKNVSVELGKFTVVVGDSNSGKSSFVRALKAVVSNTRGSQFVTRGQSKSTITVENDTSIVTLEKGEGSGSYKLAGSSEQVFTKIGTSVPPEITAALKIPPVEEYSVHFAGQHDLPYLLKDSGASVARVLGDLTNVSIMFEAVREGNRRRNSYSTSSRLLSQNLDKLSENFQTFKNLAERKKALEEVEALMLQTRILKERIDILSNLISSVSRLEDVEHSLLQLFLPDADRVEDCYGKLSLFKSLLRKTSEINNSLIAVKLNIEDCDDLIVHLELKHKSLLLEYGECPTCGQRI